MKTDSIRDSYLNFFAKKGHKIVASDSLVPQNDPTLLFTGAGMNQFKEYFLGLKKDLKRATSSQKCLRTGDLDEVGKTPYHHSFFEMLGNFSFGDYFKEEAIAWAWEYLTKELSLPKERLRISVHEKDDEAFKIWRDKIGVRENWIHKLGDKSNFWPANAPAEGPNGPCGPCSEIYFDQNPQVTSEDISSSRFAEIWNLVFTQFDRQDGGKLAPLQNKNIDTGMGLERLACVLQGKKTNFEIDIFEPINGKIEELLRIERSHSGRNRVYSIADHARAIVFSMADGVIPSNDGRGYVIRKLIRRALWHAHCIKGGELKKTFLYALVPSVVSVMKSAYPELIHAQTSIETTIKAEEEKFLAALETGLTILENRIAELKKRNLKSLSAEFVFELYDTYGLPDELTRNIARLEGFDEIDQAEFGRLMEEQRKRAKAASQITGSIFVTTEIEKKISGLAPTKFLGYQTLESAAKVLFAEIKSGKGVVVLDQTPFYGESGGQVGDQGILENASFRARVTDTQKKDKLILHMIEVEKGSLKAGDNVKCAVDRNRRERAMRNHTATHLLHAALREVLGKQVRQLGSLVSPEKLRFDYSYAQPLTPDEKKRIEDLVYEQILKDTPVAKEEKPIDQAKQEGAIAFFGEKYGDNVRVVTVPGFSKELCGGTHCDRTGQIGFFVITSDSSIGSGTRRMEALTGEGALDYVRSLQMEKSRLEYQLVESQKKLKRADVKEVPLPSPEALLSSAKPVGEFSLLSLSPANHRNLSLESLRSLSDKIRSRSPKKTVYILSSAVDGEDKGKVNFIFGLSPDLAKSNLDLRELLKEVAELAGVSGGGRKDLIQAGGQDVARAENNWDALIEKVSDFLCHFDEQSDTSFRTE